MEINSTTCVALGNDQKLKDYDCDTTTSYTQYCIINYGGPPGGIGASIVAPSYNSGTITCGDKPPPSSESKMKLADDADQPVLMCPGEKAKYVCNTDGINVRFDKPTTDEYEVTCKVKKILKTNINF